MKSSSALSNTNLLSYGSLALPLAFAGLPLYLYVPDYYITQLGIPMTLMGILLLAVRAFDAIQDPLIGYLSDRFNRIRPILITFFTMVMGLGFFLLYNPMHVTKIIVWFLISIIMTTLSFSVVSINLNAMGSLWSIKSDEKTRITAAREGLGIVGLFLAVLTPALLLAITSPQNAYHYYAALFFVITILCAFIFYHWAKSISLHVIVMTKNTQPLSMLRSIKEIFSSPIRTLFMCYGLSVLSSSIPGVLILYYVRDRLHAESKMSLFLSLYFMAAILGIPFWKYISQKRSKPFAWGAAMLLASSSFVWTYTLEAGDIYSYAIICFMSGLALGAELILPPSFLSDLIDQYHLSQYTSYIFSIMHFISKLALALASGVSLILLGVEGHTSDSIQNSEVLSTLNRLYAVVPCVIKASASIIVFIVFKKGINNAHDVKTSSDRMYHGS